MFNTAPSVDLSETEEQFSSNVLKYFKFVPMSLCSFVVAGDTGGWSWPSPVTPGGRGTTEKSDLFTWPSFLLKFGFSAEVF